MTVTWECKRYRPVVCTVIQNFAPSPPVGPTHMPRTSRWPSRLIPIATRPVGDFAVTDLDHDRLWRQEGLRVPYRKGKKPLRGNGHVGHFCPVQPNVLWAMDFQFDQTTDARTLKLFNFIDEYTRECPVIVVERSINGDLVVATLDRLAEYAKRWHEPQQPQPQLS